LLSAGYSQAMIDDTITDLNKNIIRRLGKRPKQNVQNAKYFAIRMPFGQGGRRILKWTPKRRNQIAVCGRPVDDRPPSSSAHIGSPPPPFNWMSLMDGPL